jgi:hypothetical protein
MPTNYLLTPNQHRRLAAWLLTRNPNSRAAQLRLVAARLKERGKNRSFAGHLADLMALCFRFISFQRFGLASQVSPLRR